MANNRARPADQALAVPVEPVARLDPTGFDPSRWQLRPFVSNGLHRGWQVWRDDKPISGIFEELKWARLALAEFRNEAIAMEARQGGDGETRLHAKHDSAGRKASPKTSQDHSA